MKPTALHINIARVREESATVPRKSGDRTAVIVETESGPALNYGVQFWTDEMIDAGVSKNTDGTMSTLVCGL